MIVRNGLQTLPACLASVRPLAPLIHEWVFLDTGSDDGTPDYLRTELPGARVVAAPWPGSFATARNLLLAEVQGPWILMLDADEALAPESLPVLQHLFSTAPQGPQALACLREDLDRQQAVFKWTFLHRIFAWQPELHFVGSIHERPCLQPGQLVATQLRPDIRILHHTERRLPPAKARHYLELLNRARQHEPSPLMDFYWLTHPETLSTLPPEARLQQLEATLKASCNGPPPGQALPRWIKAPLEALLLEIQQLYCQLGQTKVLLQRWPEWASVAVMHAESWVLYGNALSSEQDLKAAESAYFKALDPYYSAADPSGGWQSWQPLTALARLAQAQQQPLAAASYAWQARHSQPAADVPVPEITLPALLQTLAHQMRQASTRHEPERLLRWAAHYLVHRLERQILWQAWQSAALLRHEITPVLAALLHLLWPETRARIPLVPALNQAADGDAVLARLQQALLPAQTRPALALQPTENMDPEAVWAALAVPECQRHKHSSPLGWRMEVIRLQQPLPQHWLQQLQLLSSLNPSRVDIFVWQSQNCHIRLVPGHLKSPDSAGIPLRLSP